MKAKGIKIIGWTISLILVAYAIYYFDWRTAFYALRTVNVWFFPFLLIIYIFDFILRAFRWKLLLRPTKKNTSLPKLFYSYNIAYFANAFLPARTGEFFRVFITSKEEHISRRTILGTILLERVFDFLGMGIMLMMAIFLFNRDASLDHPLHSALRLWVPIFLGCFTLGILFLLSMKRFAFMTRKSAMLRKIVNSLEPVYRGFSSIEHFSLFMSIAGLSIFMWALNVSILFLFMQALSFGTNFFDSIMVLLFQLLGELIPSAPSSLGTFHASTVIGSKVIGLTADQGLVLGVLNHFYDWVVRIIFGLVSIHFMNLNFRKTLKKVESDNG